MSQQYKSGDVIIIRSDVMSSLQHSGIVFELEGKYFVSHNTPYEVNNFGGSVCSKSLEGWLEGREVLEIVSTGISSVEIMNASYQMRFKKYDLLLFNCEHYVSIIESGQAVSVQVNRWLWIVIILMVSIRDKKTIVFSKRF
jgi:hypothetical protein